VFVVRDEELGREVALKAIQGCHAHHPDSRARFLLEAEITGGLEHPGIVPAYGMGHSGPVEVADRRVGHPGRPWLYTDDMEMALGALEVWVPWQAAAGSVFGSMGSKGLEAGRPPSLNPDDADGLT
jgi:hypothetical protein